MKDDRRTSRRVFFRHRVVDNSHLPRKLSEIRTYAGGASALLNPNLTCSSCPTTDTRFMISDTTKTPWDSIGLLARQDANSISKCAFGHTLCRRFRKACVLHALVLACLRAGVWEMECRHREEPS